jgi:hypothetical protein
MDWQTGVELAVAALAVVGLIVALSTAAKKSRIAADLQREVTAAREEMTRMELHHSETLAATHSEHEVAIAGLTNAHAVVVAEHVATADQLKADIVTLKEEHLVALDRAEQEKIAAVAKVEGKITDFRTRAQELMDEVFGVRERPADAPQPVAMLKPAAAGQMVALLEPAKVQEAVAAKEIEVAPEREAIAAQEIAPAVEAVPVTEVVPAESLENKAPEPDATPNPFAEVAAMLAAERPELQQSLEPSGSFAGEDSFAMPSEFAETVKPDSEEESFAPKEAAASKEPAIKDTMPWLHRRPLEA